MKIAKKQSKAFGKDIYLLGEDQDGTKYWLEAPHFDCGWYWGFGYIETYTNNRRPDLAKDIASHQHIDGLLGQQYTYDYAKQCFVVGDYIHNLYNSPLFAKTTFTSEEFLSYLCGSERLSGLPTRYWWFLSYLCGSEL